MSTNPLSNRPVILLLIPNLNFGGAQRVFYNLSVLLSEHYKIVECVFNLEAGHTYKTSNELVSLNVKGGSNFIDKFYRFLQRLYSLSALKKRINPAICISHLEGADLINVLTRRNEKVITWVHGSKLHDQNIEGILGWVRHMILIPLTYRLADRLVTVSSQIKEELVMSYGIQRNRIQTIYNYFDGHAIKANSGIPIPQNHELIFSNVPVIVFSGRLARQKNILTLIKWFNDFRGTTKAKLLVLGDGELRKECLTLCEDLSLITYSVWQNEKNISGDEQVYFLGYCANPFQYIAKARAFVLPSLWEGFPLSLGEAMFCGIPVVAADCPTGPYEMLVSNLGPQNETIHWGILMPMLQLETFEIWSANLSLLLTNENEMRTYSNRSLQRAWEFDQSKIEYQIRSFIASLI